MNDFTVLQQIERQMQEQFHATEEVEPVAAFRARRIDSLRARMSAALVRLATAIEPRRPAPVPAPETPNC